MAVSGAAWADEALPKDVAPVSVPDIKTPKDVAKEPEAKVPVTDSMVSPDATNKVDEDDLIKKLTGDDKQEGPEGPEKKFENIMSRMGDSAGRLKKEDPGEVTQDDPEEDRHGPGRAYRHGAEDREQAATAAPAEQRAIKSRRAKGTRAAKGSRSRAGTRRRRTPNCVMGQLTRIRIRPTFMM